jgi:hypothetical protein
MMKWRKKFLESFNEKAAVGVAIDDPVMCAKALVRYGV